MVGEVSWAKTGVVKVCGNCGNTIAEDEKRCWEAGVWGNKSFRPMCMSCADGQGFDEEVGNNDEWMISCGMTPVHDRPQQKPAQNQPSKPATSNQDKAILQVIIKLLESICASVLRIESKVDQLVAENIMKKGNDTEVETSKPRGFKYKR